MTARRAPRRRALGSAAAAVSLLLLAACAALGPTSTPTPPPPPTLTPVTPDPQGTVAAYLDLWQKADYPGMYTLLSPLSQDSISQADFQARYQSIALTAGQKQLETRILSVLKTGLTADALVEVDLHTAVVGTLIRKIDLPLVYVDQRWAVAWSDAAILPELAGGNTLSIEYTSPARANIYDRNGLGLAVQGEAVAIGVQPGLITDEPAMLAALSDLLGLRPEDIRKKYANAHADWYVPIGEVSADEMQGRLSTFSALGGVILNRYTTRFYPNGGVGPHVIGYMSSITPEQLADYQSRGYSGDERVGQSGLEAWAETYLAGVRGAKLFALNPSGQIAATLAERQNQPAQAVFSTLDRALQTAAQAALGSLKGAAIVLNPANGAVLAMASSPSFDPNLFDPTNRNSQDLQNVLDDDGRPLLNRAAQGAYPPGSVFKVPMMGAALMSGLYTRESTYTCTGVWNVLGPTAVKYDWTVLFGAAPHGKIDFVQALAYSCDPYFYTIAYDLYQTQPDFVPQVARQFGLGEFTQIGQVAEARGLMPDPAWKLATNGEQWTPGDSVNMGIGQGFVLVTPLQIAQMFAAVRNGGLLYRPQVVDHIAPPGGAPSFEFEPIVNGKLPVTPDQLAIIQEGLRGVTTLPRGTARHVFPNFEIPVAGKTGTAEDPGSGDPHAWFAGYTEANRTDKPDIVIVVIIENIGEGSEFAAPIFRRIAEVYFLGRPYSLYPWESEFGVGGTATPPP